MQEEKCSPLELELRRRCGELQAELERLTRREENAARSTGSRRDAGGGLGRDAFETGWEGR